MNIFHGLIKISMVGVYIKCEVLKKLMQQEMIQHEICYWLWGRSHFYTGIGIWLWWESTGGSSSRKREVKKLFGYWGVPPSPPVVRKILLHLPAYLEY